MKRKIVNPRLPIMAALLVGGFLSLTAFTEPGTGEGEEPAKRWRLGRCISPILQADCTTVDPQGSCDRYYDPCAL